MRGDSPVGDGPGARVRSARLEKGWTVAGLAQEANLSEPTIRDAELRNQFSLETIRKIALTLGESIPYLGCFENMPEETFEQQLVKARYWRGHNKKEAAKCIGVDEHTIRFWEEGISKPSDFYTEVITNYISVIKI